MSDIERFLTPESMLTPGLAGGTPPVSAQPQDKPLFFRPSIATK